MRVCDMPLNFLLAQEEICAPPWEGGQLKPIEEWPQKFLNRLDELLYKEQERRLL